MDEVCNGLASRANLWVKYERTRARRQFIRISRRMDTERKYPRAAHYTDSLSGTFDDRSR